MRMAIAEQRLNEFINDDRSQREGISELVDTLDRIIK
jgi:hypothetical protein